MDPQEESKELDLDPELLESLIRYDEALRTQGDSQSLQQQLADNPNLDFGRLARGLRELRHLLSNRELHINQSSLLADLAYQAEVPGTEDSATTSTRLTTDLPINAPPHKRLRHFEIVREIGRGGFGVVYLAKDTLLNRLVALKIARPELLPSERAVKQFRREAQAAAALNHPGIVPIYESGDHEGIQYLVMPFIDAPNLMTWRRERKEPIPERWAAQILYEVAHAVHFGHESGIVHQDLKPSNILMNPDAKTEVGCKPIVLDFGLSEIEESYEETTSVLMGTPQYMAPEKLSFKGRRVTRRSDIYSMGVVLFELLTGRVPIVAKSLIEALATIPISPINAPSSIRSGLSREMDLICMKCLRKDPDRRYSSAKELAEDLRLFLDQKAIHAQPAGLIERLDFAIRFNGWEKRLADFVYVFNVGLMCWTFSSTILLRLLLAENLNIVEGFVPIILALIFFGVPLEAFSIYCGWLMKIESLAYKTLGAASVGSFVWGVSHIYLIFDAAAPVQFYVGSRAAQVAVFLLVAFGYLTQSVIFTIGSCAAYQRNLSQGRTLPGGQSLEKVVAGEETQL